MKVAVVGGGGREHAIIKRLKQSPMCDEIVAIPGNGGMAGDAVCIPVAATDIQAIVDCCKIEKVDFVVVGPDDPLALGLVDLLRQQGIPAFGPSKVAARIEASKAFSKQLMKKYGIPTAQYQVFTVIEKALDWLDHHHDFPVVVKADGLALGKGVLICPDRRSAKKAVQDMMQNKCFGDSGNTVVIEEFLTGPEVSVLAFSDGKTLVPMASSMDHKRALDGDQGSNTGGMGAIAPNPFYTPAIEQRCLETIFIPTIQAMQAEGAPFSGCLFFGLMLCADGPKVIEYNCRFGDPETQAVLPLLEGDLLSIMLACANENLHEQKIKLKKGAAACVVLASGGYPGDYQTGFEITGIQSAEQNFGVEVYHAGTAVDKEQIFTSGGRVLGVTATAAQLEHALDAAYQACHLIKFEGKYHRNDIGKAALGQVAAKAERE